MFQAGDLVVYGTTGVCRVESIDQPNMTGGHSGRALQKAGRASAVRGTGRGTGDSL